MQAVRPSTPFYSSLSRLHPRIYGPAPRRRPISYWSTPRDFRRHIHLQERKIRLLRALELLVIDEVSMLRADTLDLVDLLPA